MTLHTFNKPSVVNENLRFVAPGDQILLIEDGVYASLSQPQVAEHGNLFALDIDVKARGIAVDSSCKTISYDEFVTLCVDADHIKNWF
ncbi:MAG TPA: sulfurtransferase complex subunit TusB [Gammaproteobacteria bacterium]|nr:sulfurtransferase complex subunit TusB [Gammaproteobacteria bacterium]|tara:strand:- start:64 stop:327 length:264 start_codon:yes stop_codon:yes gene_type:complete